MVNIRTRIRFAALVVALATGPLESRMFADDSMTLEVMGADVDWPAKEYAGHAFMCIAIKLNAGIKEDCFGFYPQKDTPTAYVGWPGAVVSEFKKNPGRFAKVTVSVKKPISSEQRGAIYKLIDDWNQKEYSLTNEHCIDFVHAAAQKAGWKVPARAGIDLPKVYVKKLKELNP